MIDRDLKTPDYLQVHENLLSSIASGKYRRGDILPPEKELASTYDVDRQTVRRSLERGVKQMDEPSFLLRRRSRAMAFDPSGRRVWQVTEVSRELPALETAVLICDMWDLHWCRGASERVGAMVGPMNETVQAAREKGALIVHSPSDTLDFYKGSPARRRALEAAPVSPPPEKLVTDPPLPIDDSDGGCDTEDNHGEVDRRVWERQHPGIDIDEGRDIISDSGPEIYSCMAAQGISHLVVMGVHTNMCILNRSFGIKQMVRWGVDAMLCRDLTDSMYNPALPPYVDHDAGTKLVIEYIEKFWCPTVTSEDLRA